MSAAHDVNDGKRGDEKRHNEVNKCSDEQTVGNCDGTLVEKSDERTLGFGYSIQFPMRILQATPNVTHPHEWKDGNEECKSCPEGYPQYHMVTVGTKQKIQIVQ